MIFGDILKEFCPISGYTKGVLVEGKLLPFYVMLNERDSAPQHVLSTGAPLHGDNSVSVYLLCTSQGGASQTR